MRPTALAAQLVLLLLAAVAGVQSAAPLVLPLRFKRIPENHTKARRSRLLTDGYSQQPLYGSVRDNGCGNSLSTCDDLFLHEVPQLLLGLCILQYIHIL